MKKNEMYETEIVEITTEEVIEEEKWSRLYTREEANKIISSLENENSRFVQTIHTCPKTNNNNSNNNNNKNKSNNNNKNNNSRSTHNKRLLFEIDVVPLRSDLSSFKDKNNVAENKSAEHPARLIKTGFSTVKRNHRNTKDTTIQTPPSIPTKSEADTTDTTEDSLSEIIRQLLIIGKPNPVSPPPPPKHIRPITHKTLRPVRLKKKKSGKGRPAKPTGRTSPGGRCRTVDCPFCRWHPQTNISAPSNDLCSQHDDEKVSYTFSPLSKTKYLTVQSRFRSFRGTSIGSGGDDKTIASHLPGDGNDDSGEDSGVSVSDESNDQNEDNAPMDTATKDKGNGIYSKTIQNDIRNVTGLPVKGMDTFTPKLTESGFFDDLGNRMTLGDHSSPRESFAHDSHTDLLVKPIDQSQACMGSTSQSRYISVQMTSSGQVPMDSHIREFLSQKPFELKTK